jgi:hypothetical protein
MLDCDATFATMAVAETGGAQVNGKKPEGDRPSLRGSQGRPALPAPASPLTGVREWHPGWGNQRPGSPTSTSPGSRTCTNLSPAEPSRVTSTSRS